MADIGHVIALWRYPVSSLAGQPMSELSFDHSGAEGDRRYGLFDIESGIVAAPDRNPAKWDRAPFIHTRLTTSGGLEIKVPNGAWLPAPAPESDKAISAHLGFEAAIRPYLKAGPQPADGSTTAPRYQKAPIHLLTTASLARLKALHPEGNPLPVRFRPTILVNIPEIAGAFPESSWLGKRLSIGELELTVSEPCRRCGFTVIAQDGVENDAGILRTLVRYNTHNFGVYCVVDRPGKLTLNTSLRFIE